MSKYTTQLRYICNDYGREYVESWFKQYELTDFLTQSQIDTIENAGVWNKDKLATMIVDAYYMREIGVETPTLFKHFIKTKMYAIMETALPIIYSVSIQYDPLVNVDYTETFNRTINREGNTNGNTNTQVSGLTIHSDTPQGQISKTDIMNGKYASDTSSGDSSSTTTDKTSLSSNDTEQTTKHIKGNSGISATAQKMILQYRQNIVAINNQIIKELAPLFMGIY